MPLFLQRPEAHTTVCAFDGFPFVLVITVQYSKGPEHNQPRGIETEFINRASSVGVQL